MSVQYKLYNGTNHYEREQGSKIANKLEYLRSTSDKRMRDFRRRFVQYKPFMANWFHILCLGARLGEEVKVFKEIGFSNTVGIDLHPDKHSRYVVQGNWNKMHWDDNSFNCLYTNSIDHAWPIPLLVKEARRVLVNQGIFILELWKKHSLSDKQIKERFDNDKRYESVLWNNPQDVVGLFKRFTVLKQWDAGKFNVFVLQLKNPEDS